MHASLHHPPGGHGALLQQVAPRCARHPERGADPSQRLAPVSVTPGPSRVGGGFAASALPSMPPPFFGQRASSTRSGRSAGRRHGAYPLGRSTLVKLREPAPALFAAASLGPSSSATPIAGATPRPPLRTERTASDAACNKPLRFRKKRGNLLSRDFARGWDSGSRRCLDCARNTHFRFLFTSLRRKPTARPPPRPRASPPPPAS